MLVKRNDNVYCRYGATNCLVKTYDRTMVFFFITTDIHNTVVAISPSGNHKAGRSLSLLSWPGMAQSLIWTLQVCSSDAIFITCVFGTRPCTLYHQNQSVIQSPNGVRSTYCRSYHYQLSSTCVLNQKHRIEWHPEHYKLSGWITTSHENHKDDVFCGQ